MFGRLHKILWTFSLVAAFAAPLLAGRVVCSAEGGHREIELPHPSGQCPESDSETCHDENITVDIVNRSAKAVDSCFQLCVPFFQPAAFVLPGIGENQFARRRFESPPYVATSLACLKSIVRLD